MTIRRALVGATAGAMLALAPAAAFAAEDGSASSSASASVAEEAPAPSSASASEAEEAPAASSPSASVAEEAPAASSPSASVAEEEAEKPAEGAVPEGAPDTGVGGTEENSNQGLLAAGLGVLVAGAALGGVAVRRSRQA